MSVKHANPWLEREDIGDVTVARIKTPKVCDDDVVRAVFDPIATLAGIGRTRLVLNLAAVEFLPSSALGKLVMLNRKVQTGKGRLVLCQLSPTAKDTLEVTRLDELFTICGTEQEALQSFAEPSPT